jgi:Ca2+-dependent lipid-binding protein
VVQAWQRIPFAGPGWSVPTPLHSRVDVAPSLLVSEISRLEHICPPLAHVLTRLPRMQRQRQEKVISDTSKGVLTVELNRCMDLSTSAGKNCNSYVEFKLSDPDSPEGPDIRKTATILNERSPRFRAKQDFVYVSATSMLTLTVYDAVGALEMANIVRLGRKADTPLGKVRIPVKDVAKTGRIKDAFPLQEADQGDMHLLLTWMPVERDD